MLGRKGIFILVSVFLLGIIAGAGLGTAYGKGVANVARDQRIAQLENQVSTATANYTLMVREYNKLFSLRAEAMAGLVVNVQPGAAAPAAAPQAPVVVTTEPLASPAAPEGAAAASPAPAEPAATPEPAPTAASNLPVAEFKAEALNGTGPQEGPPPQPFQFTDMSTGEITSWLWDFGDGETSTEQNPKHTIVKCPMDLCTVSLTVCGPAGCNTMTKEEYLWVSEQCTGC